ncbi:MAG: transcription elongation factor GreA [Candidatus Buchananbacteria bacterium]|nr:transcription elongation factor GreA [Candidatus Buchananbacteria bacterium]
MPEEEYLTKEGLEKLKKELEYRKNEKRNEIRQRIEEAIKLGDLSENAEYHEAKDDQGLNEARIRELEEIIKKSIVINNNGDKSTISIGDTIKTSYDGKEKEFTIVGPSESDPLQGLISNESPIGKAFIGHKKNDVVEVETPSGIIKYKILSID